MSRLSLAVALGVGVGGALVDVSSYARLTDGLSRRWGRDDAFYGVEPGTFSFTLDNADGRFTPENPSSPLDTTLTEGMLACVQVGSRLTGGTVRRIEPAFPGGDAAWALVRVTCEDSLGQLARKELGELSYSQALSDAYLLYPFDDAPGTAPRELVHGRSTWAPDTEPRAIQTLGAVSAYPMAGAPTSWMSLVSPVSTFGYALVDFVGSMPTITYAPGSLGAFGFWIDVNAATNGTFRFRLSAGGQVIELRVGLSTAVLQVGTGAFTVTSSDSNAGSPHYFSFELSWTATTMTGTLYRDSVLVGSVTRTGIVVSAPSVSFSVFGPIYVSNDSVSDSTFLVAELSHTPTVINPFFATEGATATDRINAIARTVPTVTISPSADLSAAPLAAATTSGQSVLDALNDVTQTEQGELYTTTTGTLTAPTNSIIVRERTRPETVACTFNVEDELDGAPEFVRDITNLVSRVTVSSDAGETVVIDDTLTGRAGQASSNAQVLLSRSFERLAWGQDRLQRGANTKMRIASVVVDAMTTPTDRSADLLALIPGDRVQFTNLPATVLGFDTWDGWFLGASEQHDISSHQFTLHFTPVLPDTAIFDTDRFMANGELTLSGAINSAVTSITVASVGALLSTTETPYTIQFDDEQMTVTAVSGASSPQTVTVTRGVNGTTAASHSDGAVLVSVPDSLYAF